jgi:hypothetical protein
MLRPLAAVWKSNWFQTLAGMAQPDGKENFVPVSLFQPIFFHS